MAAAIGFGVMLACGLAAQTPAPAKIDWPAASPASTLVQRIGVTDVTIVYSRPSMRGRKIFGGLEPYGEIWRTGANEATKVTFSTPVTLNGTTVPAGTYELFSKLGEKSWTIILQKNQGQWGAYAYDPQNDVARIVAAVTPLQKPVETFTIDLSDLTADSASLNFSWERTRVTLKLQVNVVGLLLPQIQAAMAGTGKKPYYQAAQFYYDHNLDLKQALAWIDQAIAADPNQFFLYYHKATFLARLGDKAGARAAAQRSIELTQKETGPEKAEYLRLNQAVLDQLK